MSWGKKKKEKLKVAGDERSFIPVQQIIVKLNWDIHSRGVAGAMTRSVICQGSRRRVVLGSALTACQWYMDLVRDCLSILNKSILVDLNVNQLHFDEPTGTCSCATSNDARRVGFAGSQGCEDLRGVP
jgi:hypothetical protein